MKFLQIAALGALALTGALAADHHDAEQHSVPLESLHDSDHHPLDETAGHDHHDEHHSPQERPADAAPAPEVTVTSYFKKPDCTRTAGGNDIVSIHYDATIDASSPVGKAGQEFDSSRDRELPLQFHMGEFKAVPGLEAGIQGMCVGEKRYVVAPPALAYGSGDVGGWGDFVPSGAVVRWDVELLSIDDHEDHVDEHAHPVDIFRVMDLNHDTFIDHYEMVEHYHNVMMTSENEERIAEFFEHEDKDKDGKIAWEEFTGPKGKEPFKTASA